MATAEWPVNPLVVVFDQVVHRGAIDRLEPQFWCEYVNHFAEYFSGRIARVDLVRDAAQECLVDQRAGIEICGKYDELIKGYLDLLAVGESQEVITFFERDDPQVQELDRLHALPSKIVD